MRILKFDVCCIRGKLRHRNGLGEVHMSSTAGAFVSRSRDDAGVARMTLKLDNFGCLTRRIKSNYFGQLIWPNEPLNSQTRDPELVIWIRTL
jgi:hypothetical protein